jgi:thiamine-monophosphate kinase
MLELAEQHGIELVGGDTTAGPLAIGITAMGQVPPGQALLRSGARAGDELWVSGCLGDARLALEVFRGRVALPGEAFGAVREAMERPQPRIGLGLALRGIATAAIDLSDGLLGDLGHVRRRSGVGATLWLDTIPRSAALAAQPVSVQRECLLAGGDDYELLFTAPPSAAEAVRAAGVASGTPVTCIGRIEPAAEGLKVYAEAHGREPLDLAAFSSFDHFKTAG